MVQIASNLVVVIFLLLQQKSHLRNCFDHLLLQLPRIISIQFGPYSLPNNFKPGSYVELPLTPEIEKMMVKRVS